jgi:hypothetical protein
MAAACTSQFADPWLEGQPIFVLQVSHQLSSFFARACQLASPSVALHVGFSKSISFSLANCTTIELTDIAR